MKQIISQLIDDFHERTLPQPVPRDKEFVDIPGKAAVVIGMRRTGKTWFCYQKMNQLIASGIPKKQILYINFEDDRLLEFNISNFQDILDVYYGKYPEFRNDKCFFFFDEIQRIDQWEMFIRRLLDTENVQLHLTGSSSKLLSSEISTSLRGRSLPIEMFPFSFREFLIYHGLFKRLPESFGANNTSILRKAVKSYLQIGGFPEIQTLDRNFQTEILQGYMDSVLLKDIIERHNVSNINALKYLLRYTMNASGRKFSINKFYNTLKSMSVKCTKNSLYEYIDHLMDAFVLYKVPIHSRSEKSRMLNPAKFYIIDTGLLNAMTFRNSSDNGPLLENMIFMHLRRQNYEVEYVNTSNGFETDFFTRHKTTGAISLIQASWDISDPEAYKRELRGLKTAMEELSIDRGIIITWDDEATPEENIQIIPAWKWLLSP